MNADVSVRDLMNREYVGVSESDGFVETVELLLQEKADTAVVERGSEPVGVLTGRDVMEFLVEGADPEHTTVDEAMTASVPTVSPDETLDAAADRMSAQSARRLVVTEPTSGEPMGIITEHDLLAVRPISPTTGGERPTDEAHTAEASVGSAIASETQTDAQDSYEDQGICEVCGTLTHDLTSFNGQLLCTDCRDM